MTLFIYLFYFLMAFRLTELLHMSVFVFQNQQNTYFKAPFKGIFPYYRSLPKILFVVLFFKFILILPITVWSVVKIKLTPLPVSLKK